MIMAAIDNVNDKTSDNKTLFMYILLHPYVSFPARLKNFLFLCFATIKVIDSCGSFVRSKNGMWKHELNRKAYVQNF